MKEAHYETKSIRYGMANVRKDRILGLAKGSGMRVLDVACARGYLGSLLKKSGNWVGGVEISHSAAAEARKVLDQVWVFDIEKAWPEELTQNPFDLVILSEILEHVFDPETVLNHVRKILKPGGSVIITTPNFMTWSNRLKFLKGNFQYADEGMFDFGHIRWFTYAYLKKVIAAGGFTLTDEKHIMRPDRLTRYFQRWPALFAWQFVVKVAPQ